MKKTNRTTKAVAAGALLLAGLGAGVALGASGSASADTSTGTYGQASGGQSDPSRSMRPDEKLLTGTTATKVRAAALAKYPGATIQRVETDSDGVYEAHVVTKAGDEVIVQVGRTSRSPAPRPVTGAPVVATVTTTATAPAPPPPRRPPDRSADGLHEVPAVAVEVLEDHHASP